MHEGKGDGAGTQVDVRVMDPHSHFQPGLTGPLMAHSWLRQGELRLGGGGQRPSPEAPEALLAPVTPQPPPKSPLSVSQIHSSEIKGREAAQGELDDGGGCGAQGGWVQRKPLVASLSLRRPWRGTEVLLSFHK